MTVARNDLPHGDDPAIPGLDPPADHRSPRAGGGPRQRPGPLLRDRPAVGAPGVVMDVHSGSTGPPAHQVAIGTESGVAVFDLETGSAHPRLRRPQLAGRLAGPLARRPMAGQQLPGPDGPALSAGRLRHPASAGRSLPAAARWRLDGRVSRHSGASPPPWACSPPTCSSRSASAGAADKTKYYNTAAEIDEFFRILPTNSSPSCIRSASRSAGRCRSRRSGSSRSRPRCRRPGETIRHSPSSWERTGSGCSGRPRATMTRRSKGTRGSSAGTSTRRSGRSGRPTSCRSGRSPMR